MIKKYLYLIISFTLITSMLISNAHARMKCWTNSDGVKECGDKVPPEYTQKGYQELSKGGIVTDETDKVKTKEELKKEKLEAEAIARQKEKEKNKKSLDKMLLETFNSIDEIELAKEEKLKALASTIKITRKRITKLQSQLDDIQNNNSINDEENFEDNDEDCVDNDEDCVDKKEEIFRNKVESQKKQIAENKNHLKNRMEEVERTKKLYIKYIARFKELKGID
jgi:hypothetical protein